MLAYEPSTRYHHAASAVINHWSPFCVLKAAVLLVDQAQRKCVFLSAAATVKIPVKNTKHMHTGLPPSAPLLKIPFSMQVQFKMCICSFVDQEVPETKHGLQVEALYLLFTVPLLPCRFLSVCCLLQ